jgi:hypothetical protein
LGAEQQLGFSLETYAIHAPFLTIRQNKLTAFPGRIGIPSPIVIEIASILYGYRMLYDQCIDQPAEKRYNSP